MPLKLACHECGQDVLLVDGLCVKGFRTTEGGRLECQDCMRRGERPETCYEGKDEESPWANARIFCGARHKWNHDMCWACWGLFKPGQQPVRVEGGKMRKCCFCGAKSNSGIFVRHAPAERKRRKACSGG